MDDAKQILRELNRDGIYMTVSSHNSLMIRAPEPEEARATIKPHRLVIRSLLRRDPSYHRDFLVRSCESPIEEHFAKAWFDLCIANYSLVYIGGTPSDFVESAAEETKTTSIHAPQIDWVMPQAVIEDFRVDFVLGRVGEKLRAIDGFAVPFHIRLPLVIVECDGHDYHERTKEQAAKDKSRDRRLTQLGYRVLRFTGSELHRNAASCARDVDTVFNCLLKPNIPEIAKTDT